MLAITLTTGPGFALADSADAACEIYPIGEDHTDVLIPCTFSQRQGYVTIVRSDGVTHDLSPVGDAPGNYNDQLDRPVTRHSDLGDQGLIFRFPDESVYVYWNATNRDVKAHLEGDTWILDFANGEVWEVLLAAIAGG